MYVVNNTTNKITFNAQDSRLYMKMQAKDSAGEWKDIEYLPSSWCGNSLMPKMAITIKAENSKKVKKLKIFEQLVRLSVGFPHLTRQFYILKVLSRFYLLITACKFWL